MPAPLRPFDSPVDAINQSTAARFAASDPAPGGLTAGPRVLLIGPVPAPLGGVSVHIARLTDALTQRGYAVSQLDESPLVKPHLPNVRAISPRAYIALVRQADLVHIHSSNAIVKCAHALLARLCRRRVVTTIHSQRTGLWDRMLYRWACHLSHHAILVSDRVRASMQIPGTVVPAFLPPIAAEEVVPETLVPWLTERRREGRTIVVSNASDLSTSDGDDLYGLDMLIEAFSRPDVTRGRALLFVVSSLRFGADRFVAMQQRIAERGLAPHVHLVQLTAPFAGLIKAADVVVRATNTDGDALTVREALHYGKRVLASDCVTRPAGSELFRTRDTNDLVRQLLAPAQVSTVRDLRSDLATTIERVYQSAGLARPMTTPAPAHVPAPKRVLIISQFYAPDITAAAFRISETVQILRSRGLDVRVIAAEPHKAQASATPDAAPHDDDGIVRVPIRAYDGGGASAYILHYLSFVANAVRAGIRLRRSGWRADVIWASSPPLFVGIAGDVLARVMRCPMVLDVRDIWPESAVGAGVLKHGSLMFRIGKLLETWLYSRATRLTCVSRTMQSYLAAAARKPVAVVFNGVGATPAFGNSAPVARRILYAGNLGRAQGLDVLITAFAEARAQCPALNGWTVDLIGAGAVEGELRALAVSIDLKDVVRFHGVLTKPAAIAETYASAALFINLVDDAAFTLTVPSKVFDCMLADRPILYGVGGAEARAILNESGGNKAFAPSDAVSLTKAIVELATQLPEYEAAARGNSAIVTNRYTRVTATESLLTTLAAAQADRRPRLFNALRTWTHTKTTRLARIVAFARHIPPARIARRLYLTLNRRWLTTFPPATLPRPLSATATTALPPPLFPMRGGLQRLSNGTLATTVGGRVTKLTAPIVWIVPMGEAGAQLRGMTLNYMEYLESADDTTFAALTTSWLDAQYPYGRGFFSQSHNSYALSIRTVVWMQQLSQRNGLPVALRSRLLDSLATQIEFLAAHLETDIGGNHLIKNIKALLWASSVFQGTTAARWRTTGLTLLRQELSRQILADGMHYERSPSYHNQVFADLLEIRHALGADPLGGALDAQLSAMAQAVADLAHGDGCSAQFNDAGLSMSYAPDACLDAYARLFGTKPQQRAVFSYPAAGYFGVARDGAVLIADCGSIGPDDLPGHGHGDVLAFEWSVADRRVIVDQGVFEYVAGVRRAQSRSAGNHNTLSIEGRDQADFFADFRVGRRPRACVHRFEPRPDGFVLEGSHDGYGPITHTRTFDVSARHVDIVDRLDRAADTAVTTSLLLHPDVIASPTETGLHLRLGASKIDVRTSVPLVLEPAVWWPDMGVEIPTQRIIAVWPPGCVEATFSLATL